MRRPAKRTLLIFGAATFLNACAAPNSPNPNRNLTIATWNIEHLAAENGQGCKARTDADYATLRGHAEALAADVVAFQEVEDARAAERVFPRDRWTVIMSARPDTVREGYCRGASGPRIRKQDVGFAIRKGIDFVRHPDVAALALGNPDLRTGVDITVKAAKPLRLLSVHLKSGCNINRDPADRDCDILFRQAPVLEDWIDARARSNEDFAVLGDWNRRTALAGDQFLALVSDDDPPAGRLVFSNQGKGATCQKRFPDFIDHIAFGLRAATRMVPGSFREYRYDGDEANYPSDHCPSVVQLRSF